MQKKYIVRLTEAERSTLSEVVRKFQGSSQKVRRAQILLKADADGPAWTDAQIAEAFGCRTKTVENIRQRLVTEGFELTLHGQPRAKPPRPPRLDGRQEAQVIALRLGPAPDPNRRCPHQTKITLPYNQNLTIDPLACPTEAKRRKMQNLTQRRPAVQVVQCGIPCTTSNHRRSGAERICRTGFLPVRVGLAGKGSYCSRPL